MKTCAHVYPRTERTWEKSVSEHKVIIREGNLMCAWLVLSRRSSGPSTKRIPSCVVACNVRPADSRPVNHLCASISFVMTLCLVAVLIACRPLHCSSWAITSASCEGDGSCINAPTCTQLMILEFGSTLSSIGLRVIVAMDCGPSGLVQDSSSWLRLRSYGPQLSGEVNSKCSQRFSSSSVGLLV